MYRKFVKVKNHTNWISLQAFLSMMYLGTSNVSVKSIYLPLPTILNALAVLSLYFFEGHHTVGITIIIIIVHNHNVSHDIAFMKTMWKYN